MEGRFDFEAGLAGGMRPGLLGIAFLAGAEAGANEVFLPAAHHFPQQVSQRNSTVEAERVTAVHVLPDSVLVLDPELKGAGVFALLPDRYVDPVHSVQRSIQRDQIFTGRPLLHRSLREIHSAIIAGALKNIK